MLTAERIKELRCNLKLSMRGFARALKISSSTFSYYESGKRLPSLETCYKIIRYSKEHGIDVDINYLRPNEF